MPHACGACYGDGLCRNDFHDFNPIASIIDPGEQCPACGRSQESPGNCSVCGGTGEQDDD